jgi:hypothetical protein
MRPGLDIIEDYYESSVKLRQGDREHPPRKEIVIACLLIPAPRTTDKTCVSSVRRIDVRGSWLDGRYKRKGEVASGAGGIAITAGHLSGVSGV